MTRDELIAQLDGFAPFDALVEAFEERAATERASITNRLLSGKDLDQREIDRARGFLEGGRWLAGHPKRLKSRGS